MPLDSDDRQPFFKSGSDAALGDGRRYIFHNTMLQARAVGRRPTGWAAAPAASAARARRGSSSNTVIAQQHLPPVEARERVTYEIGTGNDFGWDMYNGIAGRRRSTNGINATPTYAPGHGWQSEAGGNYQLAAGTPGYDAGARIANFNDAFTRPGSRRGRARGRHRGR